MEQRKKKIAIMIIIIAFILIGAGTYAGWRLEHKNTDYDVAVVYINAGKADSILVKIYEKSYLIDTGTSDSPTMIKKVLERYGVQKLDGVFLTHTHKDHIGGLEKINEAYDIENLYSANISMNKKNGKNEIEKMAKKCGLQLQKLSAGNKIEIANDAYFEVLGPLEYNGEDDNDNSLVMRMTVRGRVFLFCGDMQFAEEKTLIDKGENLKADVLKVGNHGNKDATSEEFAGLVNPQLAVITTDRSVDDNTASSRVVPLFSKVLITDEYKYGLLVTVDKNGKLSESEA